jgi:hypothetical protein
VPIGCGSIPPIDEIVGAPVVATTPGDALAAFVDRVVPGMWKDGWIHTSATGQNASAHRYDRRREDGLLVAVVYVESFDGGWAATRWLSTPC